MFTPFFFLFLLSLSHSNDLIEIAEEGYPTINNQGENRYIVTIFSSSDIHGFFYPTYKTLSVIGETYSYGGLEYMAKYISILREEWKDQFLYLDSGDQFQGGYETRLTNGDIMTDYLNTIKVDYATIGNHEWDFGQTFLKERMKKAKYQYLVANIENDKGERIFLPNQIEVAIKKFNEDKIKIGIIGLTTIETPSLSGGDLKGVNFLPYKEIIEEHAKKLREKENVNAVILLTHFGVQCLKDGESNMELKLRKSTTEQEKCNEVDELPKLLETLDTSLIDAIIAGHKHSNVHHWIKGIPVMLNQRNGVYGSIMYLPFDTANDFKLLKEEISIEGPIPICEKVFNISKRCDVVSDNQEDVEKVGKPTNYTFHGVTIEGESSIKEISNKYLDEYKKSLEEILTTTSDIWERNLLEETALGNLFLDIIKKCSGADISIINPGGLRTKWNGNISVASLFAMSPFENFIIKFEVTGWELKKMFKILGTSTVNAYPALGVKQRLLVNKDRTKSELLSVVMYDGIFEIPIDDNKMYSIGSNDFCFPEKGNGGDDFKYVTNWIKKENYIILGELREKVKDFLKSVSKLKTSEFINKKDPLLEIVVEEDSNEF